MIKETTRVEDWAGVMEVIEAIRASLNAKQDSQDKKIDSFREKADRLDGSATKINIMSQFMEEYKKYKDPADTKFQLDELRKLFVVLDENVRGMMYKANALLKNNFVELVTDEEINAAYKAGKVGIQAVADRFKVTPERAFQMVRGEIADLKQRHELKIWLLENMKRDSE